MSGIQLVGNANSSTAAEVEANTKALRAVIRPDDWGSLGIYSQAGVSGTMAAGLAANSPIFSFRNGNASNFIIVKRVLFSAGNTATAFTAGVCTFNIFRCTSFSASDTGGSAILPGSGNKLRTSMGSSLLTAGNSSDIRIASTATLTAGTRTKDAQQLASIVTSIVGTGGTVVVQPGTPLFDARIGEHPLILVQNEGFVIEATVPVTGTWTFTVKVDWEELSTY
jgi:hypothetical protein